MAADAPQGAALEEFDVGRATWATRFVFAANGGLFATWVSRIPAVRDDIGATEDSYDPHVSIHNGKMIEISFHHEPLRFRSVLIFVAE